MTPETWARVKAVHAQLFDCADESERQSLLAELASSEPEVERELRSLLAQESRAGGFLEQPAVGDALRLVAGADRARRIGPYRIVRELGRGGMGRVSLAVREAAEIEVPVAIKVVAAGALDDAAAARLRRECRILATLDHPYVARVFEAGTTEDGAPYFVMEYVDGVRIDRFCDQRHLAVDERIELFRKACSAVDYAHQNLIVHRDLKPGNILVTADGIPKLLDFGIAKVLDPLAAGDRTLTEAMALTPDYASPEQLEGRPVGTASDVYSLGMILYELLCGKRPYRTDSRSLPELVREVRETTTTWPSRALAAAAHTAEERTAVEEIARRRHTSSAALVHRLAGDLDNIVLKALRPDPRERYSTARELARDLERERSGLPVEARPDSVTYRARKFVRRHRAAAFATAAVAIALVAGIVTTSWQARKAELERHKAERVAEIIKSLLGAPDLGFIPGSASRGKLTVAEVLDTASRRLETLGEPPAVEAALRRTLARSYFGLGQLESAAREAEQALALYRSVYGDRHLETARVRLDLGAARFYGGRIGQAEPLFRQALDTLRDHDNSSPEIASALNYLGLIVATHGDPTGAEALFREAISLAGKERRAEPIRALLAMNLGQMAYRRGDSKKAEAHMLQALAGLPPATMERATACALLARVLATLDRLDEADQRLRESLHHFAEAGLATHPATAINHIVAAEIAERRLDPGVAEAAARRALNLQEQAGIRDEFVWIIDARLALGRALLQQGRPAEAEKEVRRVLTAAKRAGHKLGVPLAQSLLGECLARQQRFAEAEALVKTGYQGLVALWGAEDPRTRAALRRVIDLYQAWGRPQAAASYRAKLPPPAPTS